jgi:guanylate kinase
MKQSELKRQGVLFCLVGPSGGGKTTIGTRLLHDNPGSLVKNVSLTSRPPRPGERDGQEYHFISRDEFRAGIESGRMFEWEEVHGNLYGVLQSTIAEAIAAGSDVLFDVEINGALKFKRRFALNAVALFVAPSGAARLEERLRGRGPIPDPELSRRLQTARREYEMLLEDLAGRGLIDYFVINDDLDDAYRSVAAALTAQRSRLALIDKDAVRRICRFE